MGGVRQGNRMTVVPTNQLQTSKSVPGSGAKHNR